MQRPEPDDRTVEDQRRERLFKESKNATVAFRLKDGLKAALDHYLADHPKENQTNLMIHLLVQEMRRLGYLPPQDRDLFHQALDSQTAVERAADELDRLSVSLIQTRRRLRPDL